MIQRPACFGGGCGLSGGPCGHNPKDFPVEAAAEYGLTVIGPSAFLKYLWAQDRDVVMDRLHNQSAAIGQLYSALLDRLSATVPSFVTEVRDR